MSFIHADDVRLHVRRLTPPAEQAPAGTVVLVHGLLVDNLASYYLLLAPALLSAGFEVLIYDQRGHGRSDRPGTRYQLEDFAADFDAVLDHHGITNPVHLVGNSFGGAVAFDLAHRAPHLVTTITMIESEPPTASWAARMDRFLQFARSEVAADPSFETIAARYGAEAARLARKAAKLLTGTTLPEDIPNSRVLSEADIRSVRCPVLTIYGAESELASGEPWLSGLLFDGRSVVVPGHGHAVLMDAADTVRKHLLAWLHQHHALPADQPADSPAAHQASPEGSRQ